MKNLWNWWRFDARIVARLSRSALALGFFFISGGAAIAQIDPVTPLPETPPSTATARLTEGTTLQGSFRVPVGLLFGKDATTGYCYATPIIPTLAALATKAGFKSLVPFGSCTPTAAEIAQAQAHPSKAAWEKAGRVLTRHEKELMAIAGVNSVSLSNDLGDVNPVIVVWVIDSKKLNSVERAAPDSLEGFPVEVRPAGHGFAL